MRTSWLLLFVVLNLGGCKKKDAPAGSGSSDPSKPVEAAGSAQLAQPATGSGSDSQPAPAGSGAAAGSAAPTSSTAIRFAESTEGWSRTDDAEGGQLEHDADGAIFTVKFRPVETDGEPAPEPAAYGSWYSLQFKTKVDKTEKLGDAVYFEFFGPRDAKPEDKTWEVVKKVNGVLWTCGGSRYLEEGYDEIPQVREVALAEAKKICASMN